jgi:hypothetical protein
VIYRYGLYFVSAGATDNEGNEVSKNLQKHSDATVFYMIRCEAFERMEQIYYRFPEMQYSLFCHVRHQHHGFNKLSSEEIVEDIKEFNANHFLDWNLDAVGV